MERQGETPQDHAFVELLPPGLPSELDLQQLLRDTEDKLKLNACSIEQSIKELQVKMGESWGGDAPPSPTECLQWFSPRNPANPRPVVTGHQELLDFLKALLQYLSSEEEGREEVILQLLLTLSSQCGVAFPTAPVAPAPAPPVHLRRDDTALEVQEAWDDVRARLRRHLLARLAPGAAPCARGVARRIRTLQQLCFLFPEAEVLGLYQGLRGQAVVALLREALASTPSGVTGFPRLEQGLRRAAPTLTEALREELQVLSGVAEPHAILGVLNAAYLGPLARELEALMERECETALRDNTAPRCKTRRISARAKAAVAPLEPPGTSRTFSLTCHQLGALTRLAGTLLELETKAEEMATDLALINCAGETVRGILKKPREELDVTSADLHAPSPEAIVLEFNWRAAFRDLAPQLARCVEVVLNDVTARSLRQEEGLRASGHAPVPLSAASDLHDSAYTSEREAPKMVAKFSVDIVQQLEALLPLALACRDPPLLEVRCRFVEACSRAAAAVLDRLEERATEGPPAAPLRTLPGLLSTCVFVHQQLCRYEARLKETATAGGGRAPLTLLPLQRYQEAAEALQEQLTGYCIRACATSLLHDAEAHHWEDPKPFYEGERCSFSIQMWYYFLSGLRSDLWAVLPPALAQDALGRVTCDTLQVLVQRYSRVRPTYRRHLQIRCDITALLLGAEQLIWSVCGDDPEAPVRPAGPPVGGWAPLIHSLCEQLLAVLVLVTAPLPLVCGTFRSGPAEGQSSAPPPPAAGSSDPRWLQAINPAVFSEQGCWPGPNGEAASLRQLRLLTSDPGSSPGLLLLALLHRGCHLPRILLEHSHLGAEGEPDVSPEEVAAGEAFVEALFQVFVSLNSVPKALTLALEPYLDKGHVWELLCNLADPARPAPLLVTCVRAAVNKPVHSLLRQLVPMVMTWQGSDESSGPLGRREVPDSLLAKVPKEWNYNSHDLRGREPAKGAVTQTLEALSFIFTNLPSAVASLPLPLRYLFHTAEKHLPQQARQPRSLGLLVWALLSSLCQCLDDPGATEQLCGPDLGLGLGRGAREALGLLSECLQAAMGQQRGVPKPGVHKVLQALEERRPKWSSLQLQKARRLCSESAFERGESGAAPERAPATEPPQLGAALALLEVCHKAGGAEYLGRIHRIIRANEEPLISMLSPPGDNPDDPHLTVNFALGTWGQPTPPPFNPLIQFNHIGRNQFDQAAAVGRPWDWAGLLTAFRGTSQVTLKTLLANRWELQDLAVLEDEEKVLVEELQKTFFTPAPESPGPSAAPATQP